MTLRTCRDALSRLRERLESAAGRSEIQRVLDDVAALQELLEVSVHEGAELPRFAEVSTLLSRHMDTLSRWSEQVRFKKVEAL